MIEKSISEQDINWNEQNSSDRNADGFCGNKNAGSKRESFTLLWKLIQLYALIQGVSQQNKKMKKMLKVWVIALNHLYTKP